MSVRDTINTWARERLSGGALARDTEAYNQVHGALPELIEILGGDDPSADQDPARPAKGSRSAKATESASADPPDGSAS